MNKLNEFWLRCRRWSDANIVGYLFLGILKYILIIVIGLILIYLFYIIGPFRETDEDLLSGSFTSEDCTVTGINLHGSLSSYLPYHAEGDTNYDYDTVSSEDVVSMIKEANRDEDIKAIVIEVDSGGGSPIAGEEISIAVKNSNKPVVAFIRDMGASASYLSISSADRIWASIYSSVGSIGVTGSYLSNVEKNKKDGLIYEKLSSGIFKDAGSADLPLTKEERALFMRDINIIYENFIKAVSTNRNIPIEKVRTIADGSTVLGEKAKEIGLIDEIGGLDEVEKYLEEIIGEQPQTCWQ